MKKKRNVLRHNSIIDKVKDSLSSILIDSLSRLVGGIYTLEKLNKNNKTVVNIALATILGLSGVSCVKSCNNSKNTNMFERITLESLENNNDIQLLDNIGVVLDSDYGVVNPDKCDFYYLKLDAGNLCEKDLERLNYYNNIGIITSIGSNVYQTIDNIKNIISRFNITGPILCDIDSVSIDEYYNVKIFCDKLEANGCYVGFYGSEDELKLFENKVKTDSDFDFSNYSILLRESSNVSNLPIEENFFAYEIDNEIREKIDLNKLIDNNNFNDSSKFVDDYKYIVQSGDTLYSIASKFNIDLCDLLSYNNLQQDSIIYPNQELIIPSLYNIDTDEILDSINKMEDYTVNGLGFNENIKRTIDISEHNGHLNWDKISELLMVYWMVLFLE